MSDQVLWVLHWNQAGPHPRLTLVAVAGGDADRAEHSAQACFARTGVPAHWTQADVITRREIVHGCRTVPTLAMLHLEDDEAASRPAEESLRLSVTEAAENGPRPDPSRSWEREIVVALGTAPVGLPAEAEDVVRAVLGDRLAGFAQGEAWPGLRKLTVLTGAVCEETAAVELPGDENLLEIYDDYTIGGLAPTSFPTER